jgi:hypothetical protein
VFRDSLSAHPGSSSAHHGSSSARPGSLSAHPDSSSVHHGSLSAHPGSSSVHHGSSSAHRGNLCVRRVVLAADHGDKEFVNTHLVPECLAPALKFTETNKLIIIVIITIVDKI